MDKEALTAELNGLKATTKRRSKKDVVRVFNNRPTAVFTSIERIAGKSEGQALRSDLDVQPDLRAL